MFARQALGLLMFATPLLSASVAGAGWENLATKNPTPIAGPPVEDRAFEVVSRAIREGRDAEALVLLRSITSSKNPPRLELARLQFAANLPAKGRRSLEQAASELPDDPRVFLLFGSLALGEGRLSDARLNGEKALALLDGSKLDAASIQAVRREANAGLATVAEAREDWPSARAHLLAWLEIEPANAQARQRLGRALFRLGKPEEAYRELTRSARDDLKLGPAAVPMALLFVQASNDPKAEEWFAKACKVEPKSASARVALARWRLDKGRTAEARLLLEEAAKLDPKSREIEPLRGLVAWQLRELANAERIFEALHRDDLNDAGYASLLTLALVEQDDPDKRARGLQLAEANARKFPNAVEVLASLGRARDRTGQPDEAERSLRAAITQAGGRATPTLAFFLADVLAKKGQREDAHTLLKQATATPIAFAYQADARKLLTSLEEKSPARTASKADGLVPIPQP